MNRQPFETPPRWWKPKMSPWSVKLTRRYRRRQLHRHQRLTHVETTGIKHLQDAISAGCGVMIAANHAAHFDSAALYVAADQIRQPLYFMTAWQVFAMSSRFQRWLMQRLGCFSIDREGLDRKAFLQATQVLRNEPHPLVIFPEGDIYHLSDRVTHFREGAAAIAQFAARGTLRPIVVIPCGIKFWYLENPMNDLRRCMSELEQRVLLKSRPQMSLEHRIFRLAKYLLSRKEEQYLGRTQKGSFQFRVTSLSNTILARLESRYGIQDHTSAIPERVKILRQQIIHLKSSRTSNSHIVLPIEMRQNMEDLFFIMQLYSYPSDYLNQKPSVERLAETLDKFEEDILGQELPTIRGRRRVNVSFGEPIPVKPEVRGRRSIYELTLTMQREVQGLLDKQNLQQRQFSLH